MIHGVCGLWYSGVYVCGLWCRCDAVDSSSTEPVEPVDDAADSEDGRRGEPSGGRAVHGNHHPCSPLQGLTQTPLTARSDTAITHGTARSLSASVASLNTS